MSRRDSSRQRYREFVQKYKERQLDEAGEASDAASAESRRPERGKRREYLRDYLRWLWPHRYAVGAVFALALLTRGPRNDRAALHAVHRRSCAAERRVWTRRRVSRSCT